MAKKDEEHLMIYVPPGTKARLAALAEKAQRAMMREAAAILLEGMAAREAIAAREMQDAKS